MCICTVEVCGISPLRIGPWRLTGIPGQCRLFELCRGRDDMVEDEVPLQLEDYVEFRQERFLNVPCYLPYPTDESETKK